MVGVYLAQLDIYKSKYNRKVVFNEKRKKILDVYWIYYLLQEFELLYYNLSSARIFFRMESGSDVDGEDEENEDSQSIASISTN